MRFCFTFSWNGLLAGLRLRNVTSMNVNRVPLLGLPAYHAYGLCYPWVSTRADVVV